MKIILFSSNKNKIKEIEEILDWDVNLYSDFIDEFYVEENGESFYENAILKLHALKEKLEGKIDLEKYLLLTEDSGICVEALDNRPGIYSARYANIVDFNNKEEISKLKDAKSIDNINRLIKDLHEVGVESSRAYFVSCFCAYKNKKMLSAHGYLYGKVVSTISLGGGFGYDPIFIPDGFNEALSKINIKNKISHRFNALKNLKELL